MKILALILTLSGGALEIRADGVFDTPEACSEHIYWRMHHQDFRKGDVSAACVPQEKIEAVIRALFGGQA